MKKKLRHIISHNFMGVVLSTNETKSSSSVTPRLIQVMPNGSNIPRKEGELLKYKNVFSGWAKRYFRLERTYLHYFEHQYDHEPITTITRGEISEVKVSQQFPDKSNVFEIFLKNGAVWYCQASSPNEMVSWMQALSPIPVLMDVSQYETVPCDTGTFEVIQPSYNPNCPTNITPSPYQDLHNEVHEVGHSQGYTLCPDTPPPPYSEQDNLPPQFKIPFTNK